MQRRIRQKTYSTAGFSLLEFMLVAALASVVLSSAWQFTIVQEMQSRDQTKRIDSQSRVSAVMQIVVKDIMSAGYGIFALPRQAGSDGPTTLMNEVALTKLDNNFHEGGRDWLQSVDANAAVDVVPEADQLVLGSTLFSSDEAPRRFGVVLDPAFDAVGKNIDVSNVNDNTFEAGDAFITYDAAHALFPYNPADLVQTVQAVVSSFSLPGPAGPGSLRYGLVLDPGRAPGAGPTFDKGLEIYGIDANHFAATGELFHKVQYALVDDGDTLPSGTVIGTLARFQFPDGVSDYTNIHTSRLDLIRDVISFQVQVLVFPCQPGAAEPVWVDVADTNVGGFLDPAMYPTLASIFTHRRARTLGIRVAVFAKAEDEVRSSAYNLHLLPGTTTFQMHNHLITGLDSDDSYMMREMVVDPINYRFRDKPWTINNQDANQNSLDPTAGNCAVAPVQL